MSYNMQNYYQEEERCYSEQQNYGRAGGYGRPQNYNRPQMGANAYNNRLECHNNYSSGGYGGAYTATPYSGMGRNSYGEYERTEEMLMSQTQFVGSRGHRQGRRRVMKYSHSRKCDYSSSESDSD